MDQMTPAGTRRCFTGRRRPRMTHWRGRGRRSSRLLLTPREGITARKSPTMGQETGAAGPVTARRTFATSSTR